MKHLLAGNNLALCALRQSRRGEDGAFLATDALVNKDVVSLFDIGTIFPLYLYPNGETEEQREFPTDEAGRRPNVSIEFVKSFAETVGLTFVPDGRGDLKRTFGSEDLFHYIYAILYSPSYRERYIEFIKLDFPRVPLTDNPLFFRKLCQSGSKLVELHTLKAEGESSVDFDVPGSNVVEQFSYVPVNKETGVRQGRVHINAEQYFEGISPAVWQMRIGGSQVCEKWLKDRKGRTLTHDDIEHYQRTVSALAETRSLMAQIDALITDHGGWPLA